jgi:Flp pilus assembly pilin Flp
MRSRTLAFLAEEGQTMSEYAVTLGVITFAVVAIFGALALGVEGKLTSVAALF